MTSTPLRPPPSPGLHVLLPPEDLGAALSRDALIGLTADQKWLPPTYFYDAHGSELFEEITRLPEYYPTRTERALLERYAGDIARRADVEVLVELGSGSSTKTALLLDALAATESLSAYVPVDVSPAALQGAVSVLGRERPDLPVYGVVADFTRHLALLPAPGRRLLAFLGGTIGNFAPAERAAFLRGVAEALGPDERFLVGMDLVKDPARLVAAYDDASGVTAQFNKNVLRVLNRELQGDADLDAFDHLALWDAEEEWIEMRLRAVRPLTLRLERLDLEVTFAEGEELRTEISAKFRRDRVETEFVAAGLRLDGWWSDGDFALALARPQAAASASSASTSVRPSIA